MEDLHVFLALAGEFGNIALDGIVEIQLPTFDEEHRRHVDHRLGDGGHVEHRVAADRLGIGLRPLPAEEPGARHLPRGRPGSRRLERERSARTSSASMRS